MTEDNVNEENVPTVMQEFQDLQNAVDSIKWVSTMDDEDKSDILDLFKSKEERLVPNNWLMNQRGDFYNY
jgi:hypothetical protein